MDPAPAPGLAGGARPGRGVPPAGRASTAPAPVLDTFRPCKARASAAPVPRPAGTFPPAGLSPKHPERPASTRMDASRAGVVRRCGGRRSASRRRRHHPIGCPRRRGSAGTRPREGGSPPRARRRGKTPPGAALAGRGRAGAATGRRWGRERRRGPGGRGPGRRGRGGKPCTRRPHEGGSSEEGRRPGDRPLLAHTTRTPAARLRRRRPPARRHRRPRTC